MRLAKLSEFRSLYFAPGSAPAPETLRAHIDREEIPGGRKEGKRYFVDIDEFERVHRLAADLHKETAKLRSDPLFKGLF